MSDIGLTSLFALWMLTGVAVLFLVMLMETYNEFRQDIDIQDQSIDSFMAFCAGSAEGFWRVFRNEFEPVRSFILLNIAIATWPYTAYVILSDD